MTVFEKELIEAFLSPDPARYNRAINLMFFRDTPIAKICRNVVAYCFQESKYLKFKRDGSLYLTIVSEYCLYLRQKEDYLRKVKDLEPWIYSDLKNYCNSNRSRIDDLLGI